MKWARQSDVTKISKKDHSSKTTLAISIIIFRLEICNFPV